MPVVIGAIGQEMYARVVGVHGRSSVSGMVCFDRRGCVSVRVGRVAVIGPERNRRKRIEDARKASGRAVIFGEVNIR